jgi:hypothetical protein
MLGNPDAKYVLWGPIELLLPGIMAPIPANALLESWFLTIG